MVTSEELKTEGNRAFGNQEYKKAAKLYRDAIKLDPSNPVLYSNRSQSFLRIGDFDRALRDSDKGLELTLDPKLKTKLYFRKGMALKHLGVLQLARDSFQQVLNIDPLNGPALEEISNTDQARKKTKLEKNESTMPVPIPIQEVEALPEDYAKLLGEHQVRPPTSTNKSGIQEVETTSTNRSGIQEMETTSTNQPITPETQVPSPQTSTNNGPQLLSLHLLSKLGSLPPNDKAKAYNYVISLEKEEYISTFGSCGIDTEFLQFFMEAAAYVSANDTLPNWGTLILTLLSAFSKLRRYQLSLEFCDKSFINTLIENVEIKTSLANDYKQFLSVQ